LKIGVTSSRVFIRGSLPIAMLRRLDRATSYRVKGFQFSEAWRAGRWDGKVHLLKVNAKGASLPIGLHDELASFVARSGEEASVIDARRFPEVDLAPHEWPAEFEERDYQREAVDALFAGDRFRLHGIVRSPVRSGKTVIQARLVSRLGKKAVVLVGSRAALGQTYKTFRRVFGRDEVGVLGDGHKVPRAVTIASVQTASIDGAAIEAFRDASLVVIDEFHHYSKKGGEGSWKDFVEKLDVPYKVGFSGTIYFDTKEVNEEDIWLRGIAGPIVYSISMRKLIDLGYLVEPMIYFLPFEGQIEASTYSDAYKELLANPDRNSKIVDVAAATAEAGEKTIIVTNRIAHANDLGERLAAMGVPHVVLTGPVETWERQRAFRDFCDGSLNVLVGTVFNETVDLPPASVVINASGGASRGGTIQKLRNLTAHDGKKRAIVFDFADVGHRDFRRHSRERRDHYRVEQLSCKLLRGPVSDVL
jgi:superfamily II DNA or RNA helicase